MFKSAFSVATRLAVVPKAMGMRPISNFSVFKPTGSALVTKNTPRASLYINLQSNVSLQSPLPWNHIFSSARFFAAKAASKSGKSASKAKKPAQKSSGKEKQQKEKERAKILKEKERARAQAEKQKAAAQKEKERERAQREKEKERERAQKEKERERLRREKEKEKLAKEKENENKSKKKAKDENKPTRARTSYTYFFAAEFPKLKQQHPNKTVPELAKLASTKWNNLSANEKKAYEDEANKDKVRYQKELDAYKKTLPPKRPLTSYILFAKEIRDSILKENPEAKVYEVAKITGDKWKSLSNSEKEKYNKQAEKLKSDYKKKVEKHQANQ